MSNKCMHEILIKAQSSDELEEFLSMLQPTAHESLQVNTSNLNIDIQIFNTTPDPYFEAAVTRPNEHDPWTIEKKYSSLLEKRQLSMSEGFWGGDSKVNLDFDLKNWASQRPVSQFEWKWLSEFEIKFTFANHETSNEMLFTEMCEVVERELLRGIEMRLFFCEFEGRACGFREQTWDRDTGEFVKKEREETIVFDKASKPKAEPELARNNKFVPE